MAAIGTWPFSQSAVEKMQRMISAGEHATDAVEEAMAGGSKPSFHRGKVTFLGFRIANL